MSRDRNGGGPNTVTRGSPTHNWWRAETGQNMTPFCGTIVRFFSHGGWEFSTHVWPAADAAGTERVKKFEPTAETALLPPPLA